MKRCRILVYGLHEKKSNKIYKSHFKQIKCENVRPFKKMMKSLEIPKQDECQMQDKSVQGSQIKIYSMKKYENN